MSNDPGDAPSSVTIAGTIGSAICLHVPDPSLAVDWLARQGIPVSDLTRIQAVPAVVAGETPTGPIIPPGLPALFRLTGSEPASVGMRGGDTGVSLEPAQPYLLVEAEGGEHELSISIAGRSGLLGWTSGGESGDPEAPLDIALDPAAPSLEMLRRGEVAIHIRTSLPLEPLTLSVSVSAGERVLATAQAFGIQLPLLLTAGEGILDELVKSLDDADVPGGGDVWLAVEVGTICRNWWPLGREARPVSWERHDQIWRPRRDEQTLQVLALSGERPLEESPDAAFAADALQLLLPVSNGAPIEDGGFVLGPRRLNFGAAPALDGRVGRSWHGLVGLSARSISLNYLRWSWAEARNPLLEVGRRRVAARLEAASVTQFCGKVWSDLEARYTPGAPDLWTALADVATRGALAAGGDFPQTEGWQSVALVRHLAQRFARMVPDLWSCGEVTDAMAEGLDDAIVEAWEDLFEEIFRREGRFVLPDFDVGNAAADWAAAVKRAKERVRFDELLTYLLPRSRCVALSTPDYQDLALEEVANILVRSHVDLSSRGQQRWLPDDDIRRAFLFWARPTVLASDPNWQGALQRLISDRQTARAVRYAALRYKASRGRRI